MDGPINQSEKFKKLHENPNHIPRLRGILILVDPLPLRNSIKFIKPKCNGELQEGDRIFRVEFLGFVACVLSRKLCHSGKGVLNWAYTRSNEINFNNKIKGNRMLEIEIEEEHIANFIVKGIRGNFVLDCMESNS